MLEKNASMSSLTLHQSIVSGVKSSAMSINIQTIQTPPLTLPACEKLLPESYNLSDMAAMHKVSEKTAKKLIKQGLLPHPSIHTGKIWVWPKAVYDAWVAKKVKRV